MQHRKGNTPTHCLHIKTKKKKLYYLLKTNYVQFHHSYLVFFVSPRILQTVVGHRGTEGHQRSNEIFSVLQKSDISMKRTLLSVQSLLHLLFDYYRFSVTRAFSPMVLYHTTIYLHFFMKTIYIA